MYNRKRQLRESVSTVAAYDPIPDKHILRYIKADSDFLLKARKNHCAILFCNLNSLSYLL